MSFNDSTENGFTFNWKIKNFSLCSLSEGSYLASPPFRIEDLFNTEWELRLYTSFHKSDVILNLFRLVDEGPSYKVGVDVKLFLAKCKGDRITDIKLNKKFGKDYRLAEPLKITRSSIFEDSEFLIPEDTLTVGCNLINNANDRHPKIVCNASTEITAERFLFSIPVAFPLRDIQPRQSITIPLTSSSKNYPDFKIKLESPDSTINTKIRMNRSSVPINSVCQMEFRGTKVKCLFKGEHIFDADQDNQTWEITSLEFSSQREVCACLDMIVFILHFELSVSDGTTHSVFENNVYCPSTLGIAEETTPSCPLKLSADEKLRCLRTDKKFCDFIFRVDEKDFPVHKAILGTASPVFYAMFDRDMKEKASSESVIEDIEAVTMEKLIDFVYTNVTENLHWDDAVKLYSAADKYQILELKQNCAKFINSNLSIENVTDAMLIADMYQDEYMKKAVTSFAYANSKEVFRSEKWKIFMENNLNLAAKSMHEICLKMTEKC